MGQSIRDSESYLPQYSSPFIGREREIDEITSRLAQPACRLLTLVGPGGIGKTRLAIEVAARCEGHYPHSIHFIPLQPLQAAENIVSTIAGVLNIQFYDGESPRQQLLNYLRQRAVLLIMDNFEHLLPGADFVGDIAASAMDCKILVTSRESLNLQTERVWHVKGMSVPSEETGENIVDYSAVRLFVNRARQVRRDFSIVDEQQFAVEICRMVEGNPLAIEMAAAHVKTLTCTDIATEIQRSLTFLIDPRRDAPERHRSMQAVFDWSWGLLSSEERRVFRRLSVFSGGFTLEAAEAVADASVYMLARLVDQSLLRRLNHGRYDIHELLRQYAEAQLDASGEREAALSAHHTFFVEFMGERGIDILGRRQRDGLRDIEADLENVRAVWERAVTRRDYVALDQMLDAFFWFRNFRGLDQEVFQFAWERLALDPGEETHPIAMKIFVRIAEYRHEIKEDIEQALENAQKHEDKHEIKFCVLLLGWYLIDYTDRVAEGRLLLEKGLEQLRSLGDELYVAEYLFAIGVAFSR